MSPPCGTFRTMLLTYRFRLLPTRRQHRALERILEAQRELYNAGLEERIDAYRKAEITRTYIDQCRALTELRRCDPEVASLPVTIQRWTLKRLDDAYAAFFRRVKAGMKPGFPRFRGKGRFTTFGFRQFQAIRFRDCQICFTGMPGKLRVHTHRPLPDGARIRSCTFHRDVKGWAVGLVVDAQVAFPRPPHRVVGVDLGIKTFAALSDGGFIPSLRAARKAERRLRVAQRALGRSAKGSHGRRKMRKAVARCYAASARARANHLHQASARLVRDYDLIVVENLNIKGLARSVLAKDVRDAAWGRFLRMLWYKAECAGARVIAVNTCNTSQDCSDCGGRVAKTLDQRVHRCPHCGLTMDRDLNAARNILNRAGVGPGLRNVANAACVQAETSIRL